MSKRIGELLVDAGHLTEVELRQALLQQKKQGGKPRLGELLLGLRKITPEVLATVVAEQHKLSFVKIPADIPQAISRRLTVDYQKKNNVLAFRKDVVSGVDQIHVAIPDPTQKELLEQIQGKFREVIRFYVATPSDIAASIDRAVGGTALLSAPPKVATAAAPHPPTPAPDPLDDLFGGGAPGGASAGGDLLDDLLGGASPGAPSGGDLLDDLFGAGAAPPAAAAAPSAADPLDDLLGGGAPAAAAAAAPSAADPLDDLLGDSAPAPAAEASTPAAADPLEDLLGGGAPTPAAEASTMAAADPLEDLLGGGAAAPAAAASTMAAADPLDDLFGNGAPASAAALEAAAGADPLEDLLGGADAAVNPGDGPHTPPAYVHMFEPKPKPPAAAAPPVEAAPAEAAPAPAPLDDSVPPEALAAGPADPQADEDAWLIQELQRLAAGEPSQADAVATVASVVRMLVRKGVIQQEALLGELGR